jgi:hypothetical protein
MAPLQQQKIINTRVLEDELSGNLFLRHVITYSTPHKAEILLRSGEDIIYQDSLYIDKVDKILSAGVSEAHFTYRRHGEAEVQIAYRLLGRPVAIAVSAQPDSPLAEAVLELLNQAGKNKVYSAR